jgi:SSS family solute:Na+ symporter
VLSATFFFYILITSVIGYISSRGIDTPKKFLYGKKEYSGIIISATTIATMIGAGHILGDIARIYKVGVIYSVVMIANILGSLILARFIIPKMFKFNTAKSISDVMGAQYGKGAKIMTAVISFLFCTGVLASQLVALSLVIKNFFGHDFTISLLISICIMVFYSALGGINSILITDVFQLLIVVVILPIIANYITDLAGGFQKILASMPLDKLNILNNKEAYDSIFLAAIFIMPTLNPALVQRIFLAKKKGLIQKSFYYLAILEMPLILVMLGIGTAAIVLLPNSESSSAFFDLCRNFLPEWMNCLALLCLMSVIISSSDSFLNQANHILTKDILFEFFIKKEAVQLKFLRVNTILIGGLASLIAIKYQDIINILAFFGSFYDSTVFFPLLFSLILKNNKIVIYVISLSIGIIGSVISCVLSASKFIHQVELLTIIMSSSPYLFVYIKKHLFFLKTAHLFFKKHCAWPKNISIPLKTEKINLFCVFLLFSYVVPFYLWEPPTSDMNYIVIYFKLIPVLCATLLIVCGIFKHIVPQLYILCCFITLILSLPFYTIMLFVITNSPIWIANLCLSLFLLSFLSYTRSFFYILTLGIMLSGMFCYAFQVDLNIHSFLLLAYTLIIATIIAYIFLKNRDQYDLYKLENAKMLSGIIAHEMRTPFATIRANLGILSKKYTMDKGSTDTINRTLLTVDRANINIDILLHNIKSEVNLQKKSVRINDIISEVILEYPLLENERQYLSVVYSEENQFINIDRLYCKYAIFNILKNAFFQRKKHNRGEIKIIGNDKSIIIEDNIIGIRDKDMDRIYENFFTGEYGGTGMGLPFSKLVINKMGGELTCESEYLQYTKFVLRFI